MTMTLADILKESFKGVKRPHAAEQFSKNLTRPAWREPLVLPVLRVAPENLPGYKP